MPIETNSEAWQSSEVANSEGKAILNHLEENTSEAFSSRDITKIFYDIDLNEIDFPDDTEDSMEMAIHASINTANNWALNARIRSHLEELASAGDVVRKSIPNDQLSHVDVNEGETVFFSAK